MFFTVAGGFCIPRAIFIRVRSRTSSNCLFEILTKKKGISCTQKVFGSTMSSAASSRSSVTVMERSTRCDQSRSYEDAIKCLNGLQTNAAVLNQMKKENNKGIKHNESIPAMERYLQKLDIEVPELDRLNCIHVSGTKGKGSTCAFTESILRHCGLKTGFYSSPHLVEVRERIRVNGKPLRHELFAKYFFECYDKLITDHGNSMPSYFRFLTIMAFHVFLKEKVDVAVLEVGLGGTYDCTNVIRTPVVCGIAKLEIDHAAVLGSKLTQIACHKAGIMKVGRPAVTVSQVEEAENVLFNKAEEVQASLYRLPILNDDNHEFPELGLKGSHQHVNAAIASQLARIWCHEKQNLLLQDGKVERSTVKQLSNIMNHSPFDNMDIDKRLSPFELPDCFKKGLENLKWLGRCQYYRKNKALSYFLDGAHTVGSIEAFVAWYENFNKQLPKNDSEVTAKVLLFFITGDREAGAIMDNLSTIDFDYTVICPTILDEQLEIDGSSDLINYNQSRNKRIQKCFELEHKWLLQTAPNGAHNRTCDGELNSKVTTVFPSIKSALEWIENYNTDSSKREYPECLRKADHVQVIVTGSFHLVGGVLKCLGPEVYK